MKKSPVAVILVVVFAIVLCMCGGIFAGGFLLFKGGQQDFTEAKAFAGPALAKIATNWKTEDFFALGSKDLLAKTSHIMVEKTHEAFRERLGPLKSEGEWSFEDLHIRNRILTVKVSADCQFAKGPGHVQITCVKEGDKWKLQYLFITSPLLK